MGEVTVVGEVAVVAGSRVVRVARLAAVVVAHLVEVAAALFLAVLVGFLASVSAEGPDRGLLDLAAGAALLVPVVAAPVAAVAHCVPRASARRIAVGGTTAALAGLWSAEAILAAADVSRTGLSAVLGGLVLIGVPAALVAVAWRLRGRRGAVGVARVVVVLHAPLAVLPFLAAVAGAAG